MLLREVTFAGEGEWKITLDVFRDLGLAFAAAMLMIYIILVAQGIVPGSDCRDACDSIDGTWCDARVLFAQCHGESNSRRLRGPGLLHGHGHDRNDRVVGDRYT